MLKRLAAVLCLAVSANAAPDKGTLYLEFGADPSTLNPISSSDAYAS